MISPNPPSMQHIPNGGGLPPENNNLHHSNGTNNNSYKPIPPPKPKNYKPPFKNPPSNYNDEIPMGMPSPPPVYTHGKSNSHPTPMVSII